MKLLPLLLGTLFLVSACNLPGLRSEPSPTAIPTIEPTLFQFPTLTPAPTPFPPTATPIPIPAWVLEFSDPILKALADQRPDIQDEFSPYNQGWYILNPENAQRPFYAHLKDGALFLELPETTGKKSLTVFNPKLRFRDFVLSFDFKFGKTEPDDILRLQYGRTDDESVVLDLSKNETWTFHWSLFTSVNSQAGTYDYFSPEYLNVLILMQGEKCAVYLNQDPVEYFDTCRPDPAHIRPALFMTIQLQGTGRPVEVVIDHVKLWDLDKLVELP